LRGGAKANVPFVCVLILKFLREGKVPGKDTEFSCHDEAFLKAGISPAITNRNAVYLHFRLAHNGPAIWGGCVTRRKRRVGSWYFSQKAVTVQGGYGALFAVMAQI